MCIIKFYLNDHYHQLYIMDFFIGIIYKEVFSFAPKSKKKKIFKIA